jgi:hypothetical protein
MRRIALIVALATLTSGQSMAESPEPLSDTGVSKEVENPVTRRITVPLRYEADFLDGPYNKTTLFRRPGCEKVAPGGSLKLG